MSLNRSRGKCAERAVAKKLGGKRTGTMGGEDIHVDGPYSIEVKSRQKFVATGWMDQCVRNAHGKTPIVVVHVLGRNHDNDLVIMRMGDYVDWYGRLGK
jgi:hypothetical protein